jgi:opacity protein-like surface antigen
MHIDRHGGNRFLSGAARAGLILSLASFSLYAQMGDTWDKGELSLSTGVAFGVTGTQPVVGGSTGVFLNKYGALILGSTYIPLNTTTIVPHDRVTANSRLYDSHFTLNIQIPIKRRWAPYGLLSTAVLYNTYRIQDERPDGLLVFRGVDDVKFAFEFGGGARYMAGESWGVKGEYRRTISTRDFNRFEFGVFYRVPCSWPFRAAGRHRTCPGCSH